MREKSTFDDEEFKEIAVQLLEMYPRFFPEDFDLTKFFFIRTEGVKPKWIAKIRKIGHPWGSLPGLENMIYLVETAAENWEVLTDSQRVLTVFHELKHVPEGGCDLESNDSGKVIEHPVQDFPECIAAANGNLFWYEPGHGDDLPNILDRSSSFDLEQALKRTGFIEDEARKSVPKPDGLDEEEDVAASMLDDIEERETKSELKKVKRKAEIEESRSSSDDEDEEKEVEVDEV